MLMMLEKPQESEQLANCRKLLNYIDGKFQERIRAGRVNFKKYMDVCSTEGCLIGWYCLDVLGMRGESEIWDFVGYKNDDFVDYFGLCITHDVFLAGGGGIAQRRAALVDHIKHLEAQEMLEAA